jgi:hypothetical protein
VKGLDLAERYYEAYGRPLLAEHFGAVQHRIAVGLVGEGSECFGFDDELSRDHDWGPGFCLWLGADDCAEYGADLQKGYDALPRSFAGFEPRVECAEAGQRVGVFETKGFYRRFIRYDHVPATLAEWRSLPETHLATATNGRVFADPLGEFTAFREGLLAFYPEDVRLKKLAARCAIAGQAGQYNYRRSVARGESVAALCALGSFVEAVISVVYLLNRRYRPFYKWMHRGLRNLPVLGEECYRLLAGLCSLNPNKEPLIEEISALIVAHLTREALSGSESDFLVDHGHAVQARIENEAYRNLPVMVE